MIVSYKLFDDTTMSWDEVPAWWANFFYSLPYQGLLADDYNDVLMDHMAHFWSTGNKRSSGFGTRYIDFYDEEAATAFLLRWS